MIENAVLDAQVQTNPDADEVDAFMARYPKAQVRDFDGNPNKLTEMDAVVAYLQMLGTLVDFDLYAQDPALR
jgi:cytochrome c oxidase cbb3-type subunit 2